jgi:nucleoside-diphosphate-sugar epimerase
MARRVPDTSKIAAAVGYAPKVSLDEILQRVIDHLSTS